MLVSALGRISTFSISAVAFPASRVQLGIPAALLGHVGLEQESEDRPAGYQGTAKTGSVRMAVTLGARARDHRARALAARPNAARGSRCDVPTHDEREADWPT